MVAQKNRKEYVSEKGNEGKSSRKVIVKNVIYICVCLCDCVTMLCEILEKIVFRNSFERKVNIIYVSNEIDCWLQLIILDCFGTSTSIANETVFFPAVNVAVVVKRIFRSLCAQRREIV